MRQKIVSQFAALFLAIGFATSLGFAKVGASAGAIRTNPAMGMPSQTQSLDLAAPEDTVRKFVDLLNGSNGLYFGGADLVYGVRDYGYYDGPQLDALWLEVRGRPQLEIQELRLLSANSTQTVVGVTYFWKQDYPQFVSPPIHENLNLRVGPRASRPRERCWQIVPDPLFDGPPCALAQTTPLLQEMAARIANPHGAITCSRALASLSNLRQLAIRARIFAAANHNKYLLGPGHVRQALDSGSQWRAQEVLDRFEDQTPRLPVFLAGNLCWTVPGTHESYAFNPNICSNESDPAKWLHPERIVLFYEGAAQQPRFRYAGVAAVGFADGHVELVSGAQAKGLIWKPVPKSSAPEAEITDDFLVSTLKWSENRPHRTTEARVWTPPQLEPDEVVHRYVGCLNHTRANLVFSAIDWVAGAHYGFYGNSEIDEQWARQRGNLRLKVLKIAVTNRTPGTATARVTYVWTHAQPHYESEPLNESLTLKMEELYPGSRTFGWKLTPATDFAAPPSVTDAIDRCLRPVPTLDGVAAEIANVRGAVTWWRADQSRNRLMDINLALKMFEQDYDDSIAFGPEYVQTALEPYLEDPKIWSVPGSTQQYSFNINLCGLSSNFGNLPDTIEQTWVVAFYEGSDEKPLYRYAGQALIAFADGRIAFIRPEDAGKLVWKVK